MKKTLIALAALAATGATLAQSSVTIYGRMDLGMMSVDTTNTDAGVTTSSGDTFTLAGAQDRATGSRLGFRGTEDLGGGLRANFVYEIGINPDRDAGTNARTRLANLSLTGGFGTVVIGTFENAFATIRDMATDVSGAPGGDFLEKHGGIADRRSQNAIAYVSPTFSGFTFSAGTLREENTTVTGAVRTGSEIQGFQLGLGYAQGPLRAQLAFADVDTDSWTGATGARSSASINNWALGVSYNLGFVIPTFQFEAGEAKPSLMAGVPTPGVSDEFSAWQIGARFPMGAFTPFVSFGDGETEFRAPGFVDRSDTRNWQIGTTYNLSTRTWVYASIGEFRESGTSGGVSWRDTTDGYSIGLVHTF